MRSRFLLRSLVLAALAATVFSGAASAADQFQYFRMKWFVPGISNQAPPTPPAQFDLSLFYAGQPMATAGDSYAAPASVTGALGPLSFTVVSGSLPVGLLLDLASGTISGVPLQFGAFSALVRVTDGFAAATATFALRVVQPF